MKTNESLYRKGGAWIEVNDKLSSFSQMENGTKQRCPQFAILIIKGKEYAHTSYRQQYD